MTSEVLKKNPTNEMPILTTQELHEAKQRMELKESIDIVRGVAMALFSVCNAAEQSIKNQTKPSPQKETAKGESSKRNPKFSHISTPVLKSKLRRQTAKARQTQKPQHWAWVTMYKKELDTR